MAPAVPKGEGRKEASADWRSRANCIGVDPEIFFPISSTGLGRIQAQAAKQVCGACTVANDCARWALRHGELYGIWGGLDEEDRRAARRAVWRSSGKSA
ncbi:WhiB family transcriptional regulator [Streptacidiphilus neutrinimicus]|uniref:WhiB family transcriptional regulator n=1 Tax=Streptacidiphilus neutrinimicus TaxID=105420 RepID=UPI0005A9521C|nr:WhiB family transcriptional regulator [Streptacidiphilus neutrinimicus]